MVSKEAIHQLIDALPDVELPAVERLLTALLQRDPMGRVLENAPEDDQPTSPEEDAASDDAWQECLHGQALSPEEAKRRLLR
jgi:hypothetical protein